MKRNAALIGVPLDLGANRRGVDMGPSALRVTGLQARIKKLGYDVVDLGDVKVPLPEEREPGDERKRFSGEIAAVCEELSQRVEVAMLDGRIPVILGGDHSIAMGSVAGVAKSFRQKEQDIGLIWFDAHGDMNTPESTGSGNVHGMPLSHLLGMGDSELGSVGGIRPKVRPDHVCLVGVRDLDARERKLVADSGVGVFTMKDIDLNGVSDVMDKAIQRVSQGTAGIHVSFDIDAVDPSVAPGVGTPKKGGLTYREAHLCLEMIADSRKMVGLDMVEINPILDSANATAELGTELVLSALGKSIV